MRAYADAMKREMVQYAEAAGDTIFDTVFFGGGTPSLLPVSAVAELLEKANALFRIEKDAEITLEANPATADEKKLKDLKSVGINRLSVGVQSLIDEELSYLGRLHSSRDALSFLYKARNAGYDNINVDLMYGIPSQTVESAEKTLEEVIKFSPEHISAYSLIVEEGTPFYEKYGEGGPEEDLLPSEEDERHMYQRTEELLEEAGYHRYEISNYAKEGRECQHNLGYWERKEYLGLGLGSSSLIRNARFKNCDDLKLYLEYSDDILQIREIDGALTSEEQMEEFVFLGMRKMEGISLKKFHETFGKTLEECYGIGIEKMKSKELVEIKNQMLRLTKKGIDVSNYVFAEILYE